MNSLTVGFSFFLVSNGGFTATQENLPCKGAMKDGEITPIDICQYDDSPYKLVCINNELKINYYDESDNECFFSPISTINPEDSSMSITSYDCLTSTTCSYTTLTQYDVVDESQCTYNISKFTTQAMAVNLCTTVWFVSTSTTCNKNSITKNVYLNLDCSGIPVRSTLYNNECQMNFNNDTYVYTELECYDSDTDIDIDIGKLANTIFILIIVGVIVGIILLICILCAIYSCCCGVSCCLFKAAVPQVNKNNFVEFPANGKTKNISVGAGEV